MATELGWRITETTEDSLVLERAFTRISLTFGRPRVQGHPRQYDAQTLSHLLMPPRER